MTAVMLMMLTGLGLWQLQRLHWKQDILARIAAAESGPAVPLPPAPPDFAKVSVSGHYLDLPPVLYLAEVRDLPAGATMGAQLLDAFQAADGRLLIVNRGWAPQGSNPPLPQGEVTLTGFARAFDGRHWFSPADDLPGRHIFTLNPAAAAAALKLSGVEPYTLMLLGPQDGAPPVPAAHLPRPPNDHFSYAMTWFGLAAALAVVFGAYVKRSRA
jgi:surfeit locus 1 family protein